MTLPAEQGAGVRRRTHPLSPLVNAVRALGVTVGALLVFGPGGLRDVASAAGGLSGLLILVAGVLVLLGVILGLYYLGWTRTEFFFDEAGDFRLDSGVLQRNERRVALSRLQSVDVVRPLLGRVVGLAQMRIEVAGGGDSRVVLSYLTDADAQALRAEILARAAGVDPGAGEAPERVLAMVPATDLGLSLLMRSETIALFVVSLLVVGAVVGTEGLEGLTLLLLTGGVPLIAVFAQFVRFFGFTVAESPDGLRLRHGLASVESQTVPPGRVQAIEISEPLLWRRRGWVRVQLNVAGVGGGDEERQSERVLLPVAPREVAAAIIARVLPGVDVASFVFQPAPQRARKRAWFQWRNLGVAVDGTVLAARRGFLTRQTAVIPHARTQSVGVSQGPWQRRLGLASVRVDTTPGPVIVLGLHRDAAEARAIAEDQLRRAAHARATGPAERWMISEPDPLPVAEPDSEPGPELDSEPGAELEREPVSLPVSEPGPVVDAPEPSVDAPPRAVDPGFPQSSP